MWWKKWWKNWFVSNGQLGLFSDSSLQKVNPYTYQKEVVSNTEEVLRNNLSGLYDKPKKPNDYLIWEGTGFDPRETGQLL